MCSLLTAIRKSLQLESVTWLLLVKTQFKCSTCSEFFALICEVYIRQQQIHALEKYSVKTKTRRNGKIRQNRPVDKLSTSR